ncbi:MAG: 8-amino-7-oxononanoate synthase [Verrucomicrobia bacterium]|nr:8-amino-7-oxononanoate synthase [Verrucomicrobiota bacterium]
MTFDNFLQEKLKETRRIGLQRKLHPVASAQGPVVARAGRTLLNFSSNDYLGLAAHPKLRRAAIQAVTRRGAGAGASRLLSGSLDLFHKLEEALARFLRAEAALLFPSGYSANIGAIPALLSRGDCAVLDRLCHASLVDGARLSGATLRVFPHNDIGALERVLKRLRSAATRNILIITEAVFSMDGDAAPLPELVRLKEEAGAWLMVDEAHAIGVLGPEGRGLTAAWSLEDRVEVRVATLGKALGAAGGAVCGSRRLIRWLTNKARSFIYTTGPCPAAAAAALAALEIMTSPEGTARRRALRKNILRLRKRLRRPRSESAIFPIFLGSNELALAAAAILEEKGVLAPAIRFPTVPRGAERLRISLTAAHSLKAIDRLAEALASCTELAAEAF